MGGEEVGMKRGNEAKYLLHEINFNSPIFAYGQNHSKEKVAHSKLCQERTYIERYMDVDAVKTGCN